MPAIILPASPLPRQATVTPLVFGGWQAPDTGGVESWVGFMGGRWSMAVTTPNLKPEPDGRRWTAALAEAWHMGGIVAMRVPQPGFRSKVAHPQGGVIVVDGAGQLGMTLKLRGITPGSVARQGQFLSLFHGGRRYLHRVQAETVVDADGRVALPIVPMLRVSPADGAPVEFAAPMIEGKLAGDERGWTLIPARVQGLSFTVSEIA